MGKRQHLEYDTRYYIQHLKTFTAIDVLDRLLNNKMTKNTLWKIPKTYYTRFLKLTLQKEAFMYNHMFLIHAPGSNRLTDNHVYQLLFLR